MKKIKQLTLSEWIFEVGVDQVAEKLGVDSSTVRHWRRGHCYPRIEQMREIKKISKGRVGYEQIIDGGKDLKDSTIAQAGIE